MKTFIYKLATDQLNGGVFEIAKWILWLFSALYGFLVAVHGFLYSVGILKAKALPKPVISVGNITVGGVGKTPLVLALAKYLKSKGKKPAILLRGYMEKSQSNAQVDSDEAQLLSYEIPDIPILVGSNRYQNAVMYLEDNDVDVFLMDDGFQHRKLARDIDIAAVDCSNPFGNGNLIPRGILRESKAALSRANYFVLTKTDQGKERLDWLKNNLITISPDTEIIGSIHAPTELINARTSEEVDFKFLTHQTCVLCSAIGEPLSFEKIAVDLNINVKNHFKFMDHHVYTKDNIKMINHYCLTHGVEHLLVTQKDYVKLKVWTDKLNQRINFYYLKIELKFVSNQESLFAGINYLLFS